MKSTILSFLATGLLIGCGQQIKLEPSAESVYREIETYLVSPGLSYKPVDCKRNDWAVGQPLSNTKIQRSQVIKGLDGILGKYDFGEVSANVTSSDVQSLPCQASLNLKSYHDENAEIVVKVSACADGTLRISQVLNRGDLAEQSNAFIY